MSHGDYGCGDFDQKEYRISQPEGHQVVEYRAKQKTASTQDVAG